jgi:hypothetical protein
MDRLTIGGAVNATRGEAQCLYEKVMLRSDVLAHQSRNEFFGFAHTVKSVVPMRVSAECLGSPIAAGSGRWLRIQRPNDPEH